VASRGEYWVEIYQGGTRLGAGFLLTSCYAVTAFHCLKGIAVDSDTLDVLFPAGETLSGRVHRQSQESDLALIDIPKSGNNSALVPLADRAVVGEEWRSPYRPSTRHAYLSGTISSASLAYQCEGEGTVEAMQLECIQDVGDYSGYSGSPIERSDSGPAGSTVLGVLIEQYPDQNPAYNAPGRSSPVLFAATIAEILRRFDCFAVSHLLALLQPLESEYPSDFGSAEMPQRADPETAANDPGVQANSSDDSIDMRIRVADAKIRALHEWQSSGILDELQVAPLKLRVAQSLVDGDS
jgi:hypothetical protein